MKLKYESAKPMRINYGFLGMTNYDGWWWNVNQRKWQFGVGCGNTSSHQPCKSVRAFRRRLRHSVPGIEFTLCSNWVGYCVFGKTKQK